MTLNWFATSPRRTKSPAKLSLQTLEARDVPAVTLASINNTDFPTNKPLFVPLTATNTPAGRVTYSASTDNASVTTEVLTGGRTLQLEVSGTNRAGAAFTGTLTLRLFEDVAPLATGRIIDLVNQGFYDGLTFHRIIDNFVIQGGDPNGNGTGGSTLPTFSDEYNPQFTFASSGVLALANSGDDTNNSQFFITDIDQPLSGRPQNLNFNHTIFGILTSGFDTFTNIITTNTGSGDAPTRPVTITRATIINDPNNGVARITANSGFTGAANVTIAANDGDGTLSTTTFTATSVVDTINDLPFIGAVGNQTTTTGTPVSFTLRATDLDSDPLTFTATTVSNTDAATVSIAIDQGTGRVTLTPTAGFTGTVSLRVGVQETANSSRSDTEVITLTVSPPAAAAVSLTTSRTAVSTGRTILLTAVATGTNTEGGIVTFSSGATTIGTATVLNSQALLTTTFSAAGTQAITASVAPTDGSTPAASGARSILVTAGTAPIALSVIGVNAGNAPRLSVTNAAGTELYSIQVFEDSFRGGVRVAVGDVTGDGQQDIIAVAGQGGAPIIRIFDGTDGSLFRDVTIFEDTFRGGLYVDVGDGQRLGYDQILVGAGFTGGPRVSVYNAVLDQTVLNYFAYDVELRTGVSVDFSDLRGGSQLNIVTAPGRGAGPIVNVYTALPLNNDPVPTQDGSFVAGDVDSRTGLRVGTGTLNSAGNLRTILTGPFEPDTANLVDIFDPLEQGVFVG